MRVIVGYKTQQLETYVQWFSNDRISGYSDVTKAVSLIAIITSLKEISVHMALP